MTAIQTQVSRRRLNEILTKLSELHDQTGKILAKARTYLQAESAGNPGAESHDDCSTEEEARDAAWLILETATAAEESIAILHTAATGFTQVAETGYEAAESTYLDCLAS